MIYYKYPNNELLYTILEKKGSDSVSFIPFLQNERAVQFYGQQNKIEGENLLLKSEITNKIPTELANYVEETKPEYERKVNESIDFLKKENLNKIVLSRRKIIRSEQKIDLLSSFNALCEGQKNCFRYLFIKENNVWMGAFSEILGRYNKLSKQFSTTSLAGTLKIEEQWTDKEIEEQLEVTTYIESILSNYSTGLVEKSATHDAIFGTIKHLKTDFTITIEPSSLGPLITELHPTPAVCGFPKKKCQEQIVATEKYPRELYSGYIKVETEVEIYFFVNLRCAKITQKEQHLFVGGGITQKSNAEKEWNETEMKSEAILQFLKFS